tara:strand:+ start:2790 stop:3269 length:480 start_codon:yes stop_codon:yes gene_type:complete
MFPKKFLIFVFLLASCNPNIEYIQYNSVNGIWHKDSIQNFSFEIESAGSKSYKSFINLRINEKYQFNNIFLIVSIRDSLNLISKDTLEYKLADKYGNFIGKKKINIVENTLLHKENLSLDEQKKYFISIEHAMRIINKVGGLESLSGVIDVGYKVEKIN